jgi:hypothetical protein
MAQGITLLAFISSWFCTLLARNLVPGSGTFGRCFKYTRNLRPRSRMFCGKRLATDSRSLARATRLAPVDPLRKVFKRGDHGAEAMKAAVSALVHSSTRASAANDKRACKSESTHVT